MKIQNGIFVDETIRTKSGIWIDIGFVALRALDRVNRDDEEYTRIQDLILEFTQSCDREEAKGWMEYYMSKAFSYEYGKPIMDEIHNGLCLAGSQKEAAALFLAAHDIYMSLTK